MSRAPGLNASLVLPPAPDKYDPQDQRELRRLIVEQSRTLPQYSAITSTPAPVSALGGLTGAADNVPYFTGLSTMALASLTPYARTIIACASAAAARTVLGLGSLAVLSAITEAQLTLSNNTTDDVSTVQHGFAPKAPNDATKFLDGTGVYSVPPAGGGGGAPPLGTFPAITGLQLRLSAELSTITKTTDGRVTQVNDLAAAWGSNFTSSAGLRPRYLPFGMGYTRRPGLAFNGTTTQLLAGATRTLAQPFTFIAVMMNWKGGGGNQTLFRDTASGPCLFISTNQWAMFAGATAANAALLTQNTEDIPDGMTAAPAIIMGVFNGASSILCNNGVEISALNPGAGGVSGTMQVGAETTGEARMVLYEILIYNKALSLTERGQLNTYYANALGIQL